MKYIIAIGIYAIVALNAWQFKSTVRTEQYVKSIEEKVDFLSDETIIMEKVQINTLDLNDII